VEAAQHLALLLKELDCVYIDTIHDVPFIVQDIYGWLPLIRDSGVLSGHDYTKNYPAMTQVMDRIFEGDLNCMVIDPSKPTLAYKNTHQGGNWWVEVSDAKATYWLMRIKKLYPEIVEETEELWKSV
jgi:hypothetical protein